MRASIGLRCRWLDETCRRLRRRVPSRRVCVRDGHTAMTRSFRFASARRGARAAFMEGMPVGHCSLHAVAFVVLLACLSPPSTLAQDVSRDEHVPGAETWMSTFSIVAFDPATNQLGVGVQSRAFAAGAIVPWAKAGVGAIATQAGANRTYGPKSIALLEQGFTPEEVIAKITADDPQRDRRQVAVIDAKGRIAVYTGKHVIDRNHDVKDRVHYGGWAGHARSVNVQAQGNTLASEAVVTAMVEAYEQGSGTMAERLMDALEAGQAKGGDTRGMQAAGILVVAPITDPDATTDRVIDIRVDDAPDPFKELRRVLGVRLSGAEMQRGLALAKEGRLAEGIAVLEKASAMHPRSERIYFELAQAYAAANDHPQATAALGKAIAIAPYMKLDALESPAFASMKNAAEFRRLTARP
jgi:uncharacterized Ntn-hydrolase superfamily protein